MGLNANMQIKELWKMMNEQTGFNVFSIKADPRKLNEIYNFLKKSPQVESVHLKNALYKGFNETFGQVIRSASLVLMVASLIISVGIIYNSLQVSFSERSWELASLRVLGFERYEMVQILLVEVAGQILLSLFPGCLLGLGLTHLSMRLIHTETFAFPVVIERSTYALGILSVFLAFIGSSFIVYKLMIRLNLIEALKARE
jgi:putative ABC transport system permease protein